MKTRTIAIVVALITLGGVGIASARWFSGHGPKNLDRMKKIIEWRIDDALDDAAVNDAQKTEIKTITDGLFDTAKDTFGEHKESRAVFIKQFKSDTPDKEAVRALIDVRVEAARQMAYAAADAAFEIHAVLEPAQRLKLLERVEAHHH
jgi:Spy/CpxP family protein refolding chaperone